MTNQDKSRVEIKKEKEMRTEGISKMISEGGLGADKYYDIKKPHHPKEKNTKTIKKKTNRACVR